jgi:GGDEF domain-containing protein
VPHDEHELVATGVDGVPGLVTVRSGASFGLVLADPHDPAGPLRADDLLAQADARMYEQKRDRKAAELASAQLP